jgi:hypothetical protein
MTSPRLNFASLTLLALLSGACAAVEPSSESASSSVSVSPELDAARQAIAQGDYAGAARRIKNALMTGTSDTEALGLVDQIYDVTNGAAIPVDDALPQDLQGMTIMFDRALRRPNEMNGQRGDHILVLSLTAPFDLRDRILDITVRKQPSDEIVLDGQDARQWGLGINRDDPNRFLSNTLSVDFAANGLYSVDIILNDAAQTRVSSWFIITRAIAGSDPTIQSPENQNLGLERPDAPALSADATLRFADFKSDRFKPYESRNLVGILRYHQFINGQRSTSSYWKGELTPGETTELRAGAAGIPLLVSGEYRFAVDYQESRPFGSFQLARGTQTIVRFFAGASPLASCASVGDRESCIESQSANRGVCVWGFQNRGCMDVADTNPIAGRCDILHSPAACSFHNVSCVWSGEACILKR